MITSLFPRKCRSVLSSLICCIYQCGRHRGTIILSLSLVFVSSNSMFPCSFYQLMNFIYWMNLVKFWSICHFKILELEYSPHQKNLSHVLSWKKNLPACLHVWLRLESTNHQKIGEIIKALQICKRSTQTASL